MSTITQARQAVRLRIEQGGIVDRNGAAVPLRWPNENADSAGSVPLPDNAAPFVYTEFLAETGKLVSYGGGRGNNRYRHSARVVAYVFVPSNDGLDQAELIAEQIATLLRSYRDTHVNCFEANVLPGGDGAQLVPKGLSSGVDAYFWTSVEVSLFYDLIG